MIWKRPPRGFPGDSVQSDKAERLKTYLMLLLILALALALRVLAFDTFARGHEDELYQYFERAHRLVFDYGITTWEQRYGIRNWIIPQLIAPAMALAGWLGSDPIAPVALVRSLVTGASLSVVLSAYAIGAVQSRTAGLLAALAVAIWPDAVGMGSHVLSENLAAIAALAGCALAMRAAQRPAEGSTLLVLAGLLLGLGFLFRFQTAVFSGVLVLFLARTDWRMWRHLLLGGLVALAIGAISDLAAGQAPFLWVWQNVHENVIVGRAARYGIHPWYDYPWQLILRSQGMLIIFAVLALFSGPRLRPLLLACVAELLALSLISHKEVRFVFLSATGLVILGAVGAVRLFEASPLAARVPRWALAIALLVITTVAYGPGGIAAQRGNSELSRLAYKAARDPQVCGIAMADQHFWHTSYAFLGRPVPIYAVSPFRNRDRPPEIQTAANAYVGNANEPLLKGYRRVDCRQGEKARYCLWRRAGPCDPTMGERFEVQNVLNAADL